jgi:hypothetical protein
MPKRTRTAKAAAKPKSEADASFMRGPEEIEMFLPCARYLPVKERGKRNPIDWWDIAETGNPALDGLIGKALGGQLVRRAVGEELKPRHWLRFVMVDMIKKGRVGPIEMGLLDAVEKAARAGALNC